MTWLVVSTYQDGDRVLEAVTDDRERADTLAPSIRDFREDQDEMPTITVESA